MKMPARLLVHAKNIRHAEPLHKLLILLNIWLLSAVLLSCLLPPRWVMLNLSPSVPIGLYVAVDEPPAVGQLAEIRHQDWRSICGNDERFILKPIYAGPGDQVDTTGSWLHVNGRPIAPIAAHDSEGRLLEVWRGNRVLNPGEFFVFSDRVWNSWDSRYIGPISARQIVAVRRPLWVWGEHKQPKVNTESRGIPRGELPSVDKE